MLRDVSIDWINIEKLTRDRIENYTWEAHFPDEMGEQNERRISEEAIPTRSQHISQPEVQEWICRWDTCGKVCKSKPGLSHHKRMMHIEKTETVPCPKCGDMFSERSNVSNHLRTCKKKVRHNNYFRKMRRKNNIPIRMLTPHYFSDENEPK